MGRAIVVCMVLAISLCSVGVADAARVWSAPSNDWAQALAVASDGTEVTAFYGGDRFALSARSGGGSPQTLSDNGGGAMVAAAPGGRAIVAFGPQVSPAGAPSVGQTFVATAQPGGTFSAPVEVAQKSLRAATMNAAGDVAVVVGVGGADAMAASFRPADGAFGALQLLPGVPSGPDPALALTTTGDTVVTAAGSSGVVTAARSGDGPISAPATLSADGSDPRLVATDDDRVLAAWLSADRRAVVTAVRSAGGLWSTPVAHPAPGEVEPGSLVSATGGSGATVAWRETFRNADGAAEGTAGRLVVMEGTPEALGDPRVVDAGRGDGPQVAMSTDGSAILAWSDFASGAMRVARSGPAGQLGEPEDAFCLPLPFTQPRAVGLDDAGNARLLVGTGVARDRAADSPSPIPDCPAQAPIGVIQAAVGISYAPTPSPTPGQTTRPAPAPRTALHIAPRQHLRQVRHDGLRIRVGVTATRVTLVLRQRRRRIARRVLPAADRPRTVVLQVHHLHAGRTRLLLRTSGAATGSVTTGITRGAARLATGLSRSGPCGCRR